MEIWIESQNGLYVGKLDNIFVDGKNVAMVVQGQSYILGEYKNDDRAKTVMRKVTNLLQKQYDEIYIGGTTSPEAMKKHLELKETDMEHKKRYFIDKLIYDPNTAGVIYFVMPKE